MSGVMWHVYTNRLQSCPHKGPFSVLSDWCMHWALLLLHAMCNILVDIETIIKECIFNVMAKNIQRQYTFE